MINSGFFFSQVFYILCCSFYSWTWGDQQIPQTGQNSLSQVVDAWGRSSEITSPIADDTLQLPVSTTSADPDADLPRVNGGRLDDRAAHDSTPMVNARSNPEVFDRRTQGRNHGIDLIGQPGGRGAIPYEKARK